MRERAQQQAQALNSEFQVKIKPPHRRGREGEGDRHPADSQVVLTVNKDFDISQDVIVKADDAERQAEGRGRGRQAGRAAGRGRPPAPVRPDAGASRSRRRAGKPASPALEDAAHVARARSRAFRRAGERHRVSAPSTSAG